MSVEFALLGFLEGTPRYGYDLKRLYQTRFPELRPLAFSQIYSTLARLQRSGLVTLVGEEPGLGPDRKRYAVTPAGTVHLEQWLSEPEPAQSPIQSELFLKISFGLLSGRPVKRLLDAQRRTHLARMKELTQLKEHGSEAEKVLADYALFHLEADLRWIDHTATRLSPLRADLKA